MIHGALRDKVTTGRARGYHYPPFNESLTQSLPNPLREQQQTFFTLVEFKKRVYDSAFTEYTKEMSFGKSFR